MRMHEFPKIRWVLEWAFARMSSGRHFAKAHVLSSESSLARRAANRFMARSGLKGCSMLKINNIMRNSDL